MGQFEPRRPDFEAAVRDLNSRMPFSTFLGIELDRIEPGRVLGRMPRRLDLMQQHGELHAGAVIGLVDQMAGLAAYSLMSPAQEILSVNFSVQLLRPAGAAAAVAHSTVVLLIGANVSIRPLESAPVPQLNWFAVTPPF